jgi:hypothetical protein
MPQLGDLRHSSMGPCGMSYDYLLLFVYRTQILRLGLHCREFAHEP